MPRVRSILGDDAEIRIIMVERAHVVAPDMGAETRPVIEKALRELRIETRLGTGVASLEKSGITLRAAYPRYGRLSQGGTGYNGLLMKLSAKISTNFPS